VVQGTARAGTTVLEGQLRVLLTSPKEMNTFLPVKYLQPVSCQSNHVYEPSSPHFVSESRGVESLLTPTPAEITTIPYPSHSTSTCTNVDSQYSFVSQTGISVMNESTQCTAPLIAQSMGLQCAIFADTGDLKSLFALFHWLRSLYKSSPNWLHKLCNVLWKHWSDLCDLHVIILSWEFLSCRSACLAKPKFLLNYRLQTFELYVNSNNI